MKSELLPFVWEKITVSVSMIVPIGSIILTFLIGYGLLEFTGIILKPIMRPIFKLPVKL